MQDKIVIHGARAHNLKILTWKFAGQAGRGDGAVWFWESPVWLFDTLYAEGQRRYVEVCRPMLGSFGQYGKAGCGLD